MIKKEGKVPANARADINYTGKKPKIKFAYPPGKNGKNNPMKDARKQQSIGIHTFIIFLGLMTIFALYSTEQNSYPESCNVTLDEGYVNLSMNLESSEKNVSTNAYTSWVNGATFNCSNGN